MICNGGRRVKSRIDTISIARNRSSGDGQVQNLPLLVAPSIAPPWSW